jgi:hypothetical protein
VFRAGDLPAAGRESTSLAEGERKNLDARIEELNFKRVVVAGVTHLLDSAGKIVAQRDRPLPAAESGASSWQEVHLRLPTEVPAGGLRLRIGVYDPRSGTRLRIALPSAAASRFSLTDQDTALITPY